eukprot:g48331.t1
MVTLVSQVPVCTCRMSVVDYAVLEDARNRETSATRPFRGLVAGLGLMLLAGARHLTRARPERNRAARILAPTFTPRQGVDFAVVKPGPLGGLQAIGPFSPKVAVTCLFLPDTAAPSFTADKELMQGSLAFGKAWLYGARTVKSNSLGFPTGSADDILKGQLFCWPPEINMASKITRADALQNYRPSSGDHQAVQRGEVLAVNEDGATVPAYWYFLHQDNHNKNGHKPAGPAAVTHTYSAAEVQKWKPYRINNNHGKSDWVAALAPGLAGAKRALTDRSFLPAGDDGHPPRILILYGSLRTRSFSRLLAYEFARILELLGSDVRVFDPHGLPQHDTEKMSEHAKVVELRNLSEWSEGQVWVSPEQHGAITGLMKSQLDWIPLSLGSVRPTQGRTLAVAEVCGGSQSFNAVNTLRLLGRWMRMITIPNQSSVPKAWTEFDEHDRMKPSSMRDRVVDVAEELFKFTLLTRSHDRYLVDRYSEREEIAAKGRLLSQAEKEAEKNKK